MNVEDRIVDLGLEIPETPEPVASYISAVQSDKLVFTSGQVAFIKGELSYRGKLGESLDVEDGYQSARIAAMNCLSAAKSVIGNLDRIKQIVRMTGFVNSAPKFVDQPRVLNGASDLLIKIFGDKGKHSRLAIGAAELPLGASVEIEMIIEIY